MKKLFLMGVIMVVALTFVLSSCTTPPLKDDYVSDPGEEQPTLPEEPSVTENGNLQPPALPEG